MRPDSDGSGPAVARAGGRDADEGNPHQAEKQHERDQRRESLGEQHDDHNPGRDQLSVVYDSDAVGDGLDLFEDVTGEEHGHTAVTFSLDDLPEFPCAVGVEAGGRLVEDEQVGRADQSHRQRESLAHPRRVLSGRPVRVCRRQVDTFEQFVRVGGRVFSSVASTTCRRPLSRSYSP